MGAALPITGRMLAQSLRPVVLLTRPEAASARFAAMLPAGTPVEIAPMQRIDRLPVDPPLLPGRALIFTSRQGVAALGPGQGLAVCVGDATAQAARDAGYDAVSAGADADAVVALVQRDHADRAFTHVRGRHSRGAVAARLTAAGIPTDTRIVYDQTALPLSGPARALLTGTDPVLVPLFSPRSAELFVAACPEAPMAEVFCLSTAVAEAAAKGRYRLFTVAGHPTARAMAAALSRRMRGGALDAG